MGWLALRRAGFRDASLAPVVTQALAANYTARRGRIRRAAVQAGPAADLSRTTWQSRGRRLRRRATTEEHGWKRISGVWCSRGQPPTPRLRRANPPRIMLSS